MNKTDKALAPMDLFSSVKTNNNQINISSVSKHVKLSD